MKMRLWAMTLAAMAVLVAAVIPAEAGIQWVGGNDGTQHWGVPGNWHKSRLPESTDEVNIGSTLNLGDAWVLFDASDGTGLTNQCYLGRDYNARLDQSGGTIDVNMWLAICGNPDKYGTYNLSEGRLEIDNQADDFSSLVIGSDLKRGNFLEPAGVVGPGEMNHTGGQIYTRDMCVGTLYDGKYAVAPAGDLDVIDDLILGDYSTLELLFNSASDLDMTVGNNMTLDGDLVVTGTTPAEVAAAGGVLIATANSFSGSFDSITPGYAVEFRPGGSIGMYLTPEPVSMILLAMGGLFLRRRRS